MSTRPLLEPRPEDRQDDAVRLRREIAGLEQELTEAKEEAAAAKLAAADAVAAIRALRNSLDPFYKALKMVYGEISRVDAGEVATAFTPTGKDPRWDIWKSKLGGRCAEFIDLLLDHREMNTKQLAAAAHCDPRTVTKTIFELNKACLVNKNGGKFSLKEL